MYPLKQSTAITVPFFAHDVNGDGVIGLVDAGFTKRISKNGGAFAAMTVTITEMENGWYSFPLSTTHSDTLNLLSISFSHASTKRVNLQFRVHARIPDDLAFPTTSGRSMQVETDGMVHSDVKEWLGVAPSVLIGGRVDADMGAVSQDVVAANNLESMLDGTGGVTLTANITGNLSGSVGSVTGSVGSVTGAVGSVTAIVTANVTQLGGVAQSLTDLKDFADAGYDPATNKVQGVVLVDTTTTNTDQRGTDGALTDKVGYTLTSADKDDLVNLIFNELSAEGRTAGSFGQLLKDNLDAAVSSRSSHADPDPSGFLDVAVSSRATPAQVNSEVSDVLKVDTIAEQAQGNPPVTPTFEQLLGWLYMAWRNEGTRTATQENIKNDAGTVLAKSTLSDDGTTFTRTKRVSGP